MAEQSFDQTHQINISYGRSEPLIIDFLFLREKEHLPKSDYLTRLRSGDLDLSVRRDDALDWILKACAHYNFGPLSVYLSMNYLDRFLSVFELPRGQNWTVQLLAVACLSLATKMEEIEVPLMVDLQVGDPKVLFEGKTIQRMELLVLNTLKWRMHPCTPCCFIDYFLKKMMDNDQVESDPLICRSIQYILSSIKGTDFLEFRPSEIAAAVAISVSGEIQAIDIDRAISCFMHLEKDARKRLPELCVDIRVTTLYYNHYFDMIRNKERVVKCVEVMKDLTLISESVTNTTSTRSVINGNNNNNNNNNNVPKSPNGVLEAACLSYKSDERTVGSCPNSSSS